MLAEALKRLTPEDYLKMEETSEIKHEYYQGELFALAGGSYNHNVIAGNFFACMHTAFRKKACSVFNSDMRVLVKQNSLYTYPDVSALCGEIQFAGKRNDTITNPALIIEVLSEATKNYDRGQKFELYRALPSLKEYILIHQDHIYIEQFVKQTSGKWLLSDIKEADEVLHLESVGEMLPLQDVYSKVEWDKPEKATTKTKHAKTS